jgi:Skp family chaperone for outer membrane proteins
MVRLEVLLKYARQSRLGIALAMGLWLGAILTALPGAATPVLDAVPTLENITSQLQLSAEQESRLRPMFQDRKAELTETQSRLQSATSQQQKQDILRAARARANEFNTKVEGVLTATQIPRWRELRSQTREKIKERAEEKRSSQ